MSQRYVPYPILIVARPNCRVYSVRCNSRYRARDNGVRSLVGWSLVIAMIQCVTHAVVIAEPSFIQEVSEPFDAINFTK